MENTYSKSDLLKESLIPDSSPIQKIIELERNLTNAEIKRIDEKFHTLEDKTLHAIINIIDQRFQSQEKALHLAVQTVNERFALLSEAMEGKFLAATSAVNYALATTDKAVTKAENAVEKRFESVNEFRATLDNQTKTFIPRVESEKISNILSEKIDDANIRINRIEASKDGSGSTWVWVFGAVGTLIGIVGFIFVLVKGAN